MRSFCPASSAGASFRLLQLGIAVIAGSILLGASVRAETLVHAGVERGYVLHAAPRAEGPRPLFLLLHPGGSNAAQFRRQIALDAEADAAGAVAVYPEAIGSHWNDGRRREDGSLVHGGDDTGFLLALIDRLVAEGLADPAAVHIAGHSNGGMLALRLGCERPARFRSVAAVNANLPADLACANDLAPVALLLVQASADPYMPFEGGPLGRPDWRLGRVLSADATVAAFARRNGCGRPRSEPGTAGGDTPTTTTEYDCRGAPLVRVVVQGSGHGWPGSFYGPRMTRQFGPTAQSFDATAAIVRFFLERNAAR